MKYNTLLENVNIDKSWNEFIYDDNNITELQNILNQIQSKEQNECGLQFLPNKNNIFRFLENNLFTVKYIVLGMDPYPSYYIENDNIIPIATGRSFEVSNIKSWKQKFKQKSLTEILKTLYYDKYKLEININDLRDKIIELNQDIAYQIISNIKTKYNNSNMNSNNSIYNKNHINIDSTQELNLKNIIKKEIILNLHLSQIDIENIISEKKIIIFNPTNFYDVTELQGMLWLNSTLTVEPNNSGSHMKIWNKYMNNLFRYILSKNKKIKYLVFGEQAKNRIINIINKDNMIITCHPASRFNNDFVINDCFKELKDILLYL